MELTLTRRPGTQVAVTCNGRPSHTFDLRRLIPDEDVAGRPPHPLADAVAYGQAVFQALFPPETPARQALADRPERILLVATDPSTSSGQALQSVPWEYAHGPEGFVVLDCHFVRGLPANQRIDPPALDGGLHIVAVPSNPLDEEVDRLNIDGEWVRLTEIIRGVPHAIQLERTRPPTLEQLRQLVAGQRNRIVHFMGHGGQHESGAVLLFEKRYGALHPMTARDFTRRLRGAVFLVTLNACVSATPGPIEFSNLAAALVAQRVPYALGMQFVVADEDALALSRVLYSELARGSSVEEAVLHARLTLADSRRRWAVGVPVLYTSLKAPAPGFAPVEGTPHIDEHQPRLEVDAIPRAEGAFQGRIDELKEIGERLTGDRRPRILTIHGGGGQGKTALAREAVERFAHAWPGGVWAITLETLPTREVFAGELARFLGVPTGEIADPAEVERQLLARLGRQRTLIVLDNAETLVQQVEAGDDAALDLAQFVREQLPGPRVSLLVTSREHLGWSGEVALDLGGLASHEGALLFRQSAPQRADVVEMSLAERLSEKVAGHPLSLRLLGGAFNASPIALPAFVEQHEEQLIHAEDRYKREDHRHRTLYASIDTSVRYLDDDPSTSSGRGLRDLLSGLWIFHAPFLPEVAAQTFRVSETLKVSDVPDQLHTLWRRGLLEREVHTLSDGNVLLYRLLPTVRPYAERYMEQAYEREALLARFGEAYAELARFVYREMDRSAGAIRIAQRAREDLDRGVAHVEGETRGYYLLHWGWVLKRLGDTTRGLDLTESALEIARGHYQQLELEALNNIGLVYDALGEKQQALGYYEQALPLMRQVGDRAGEATTLNNIGGVY
ncbi:MAG: CHAT domain-containing protein, partial [Anaerolineae bacterium]